MIQSRKMDQKLNANLKGLARNAANWVAKLMDGIIGQPAPVFAFA